MRETAEDLVLEDAATKGYIIQDIPTAKQVEEIAKLKIAQAMLKADQKQKPEFDSNTGEKLFSYLRYKSNHLDWHNFEN